MNKLSFREADLQSYWYISKELQGILVYGLKIMYVLKVTPGILPFHFLTVCGNE